MALLEHTDLEGILIASDAGYQWSQCTAPLPKGVYDIATLISTNDAPSAQGGN